MITAELHQSGCWSSTIESYETLEQAITELVQMGWEDEAQTLLTTPILLWDENGVLMATISYSPSDDPNHPLMHVFVPTYPLPTWTYRWQETEDSYTAVRV